jgi:hypothetical protein
LASASLVSEASGVDAHAATSKSRNETRGMILAALCMAQTSGAAFNFVASQYFSTSKREREPPHCD